MPHDDLPQVAVELLLPVSTADDPPGLGGLAALTARALTEGTRKRSAQEVAEAFDYLGASFHAETTHDATVLALDCLEAVLDDALELFVEVVAQPAFDPKEVGRLRDERLDEIARGMDEPRFVANLKLLEAIFGPEHPYGRPEGGRKEEVERIDSNAIREFHRRTYAPRGSTLVLVGCLDLRRLERRLEASFSAWSGSERKRPSIPLDPPKPAHGVLAVQRDGSAQSEVRLGGVGIARRDADYFAFKVMNAILGGLFNSRVNMNLREAKGWTYGAYTRFETHRRPGPLYGTTAVEAAATADALHEIVREVRQMRDSAPSEGELDLARNALRLSLPRLLETPAQVAAQVAEQVVYDLPDDYWEEYAAAISAVRADAVLAAARRYLRPDSWAAVIVGDILPHVERLARFADVSIERFGP